MPATSDDEKAQVAARGVYNKKIAPALIKTGER